MKQLIKPKLLFLTGISLSLLPIQAVAQQKPNVLFLIADDLRPELGCYGVDDIKTPNIDHLAASSVIFKNAYCNVPVCGASRASLLTGVYPGFPDRFVQFDAYASKDYPGAIPISGWFRQNGYYTVSDGKVFHNITDHDNSWSEYPWRVNPNGYGSDWAEYNKWELWMNEQSGQFINPKTLRGPYCESADVSDDAYDDGKMTVRAIQDLKRLKKAGHPFFLSCGFWRPHLPYNSPKKYWDMYDRSKLSLPGNFYKPQNLPEQVIPPQEVFSYARVEKEFDEAFLREARHAYYACASYIDAQIGVILNTLDDLDLSDNTIIVLLGDNGYALGEHTFWGKHTLMDVATHVPLLIRAPGYAQGETLSMAEFVDIYPTLCELCGIPQPAGQLQGKSLVPILNDPKAKVKDHVFIQWQGGDNITDSRYSYSQWTNDNTIAACMLYDHKKDPQENRNVAAEPRHLSLLRRLAALINEWKINL